MNSDQHALLKRQLKRLGIDPQVPPDAGDSSFNSSSESVAEYEACIEGRKAFRDFTYRLTRADGVQRFVRICGEPVFDESGEFRGYRGVGRDRNHTGSIAMAHSLEMTVVAEGVESHAQLEIVRQMGCDEAKGHLLGRPMSAVDQALRLDLDNSAMRGAA